MTREEAIEILNRDDDEMRKGYFCINDFLAIEALKQEPKTGHWIRLPLIEVGQKYSHECSLCGRRILAIDVGLSEFPYCHCGAKMEVEE